MADRRIESVASLKGVVRPVVAGGALWSGLAPDDSPLIMRDAGIREIYALELELP